MSKSSLVRTEWGRQLLALERARAESDWAAVAGRVHDRAVPHLATLLGLGGVQALLRRCARLSMRGYPWLAEPGVVDTPAALTRALQAQPPEVTLDAAATLFSNFFAMLETFIGRRLTLQLLRGAWPELDDAREETP